MKRKDSFDIVSLAEAHDRKPFDCGVASLNDFLHRYARQNQGKNLSRTFVATQEDEPSRIVAYYTLSASSVKAEFLPKTKLPRYPVPVAHLGRLAVDKDWQGFGLGEYLLVDALRRTREAAEEMGIYAVEVMALDENVCRFYEKFGFVALSDDPQHLYLTMKTIVELDLLIDE